LHQVGSVFGDRNSGARRNEERHAARLAELQRGAGVFVDEGRLDRRLVGRPLLDHRREPVVDHHQPLGQRTFVAGRNRAAGGEDQPVASNVDHAPAGAPEPRVDTENANRTACHRLGDTVGRLRMQSRPQPAAALRNRHRRYPLLNRAVIDLPDSATFAAALAERRIIPAMAVAALAGLVRGFSGFGGAMIFMPLAAAIYDPRIAAVSILLADFVSTMPFAIPETRRCNWREVLPLSVAMAVGVPFGTWALLVLDPIVLRWCIAIVVLSLLPPLMLGWR